MCLSYLLGNVRRPVISKPKDNERCIINTHVSTPNFGPTLFGGIFHCNKNTSMRYCSNGKFKNTFRIGYKCLSEYYDGLGYIYCDKMKRNVWYNASGLFIRDKVNQTYVSGFHILWNREDARKFKKIHHSRYIYRVVYTDVTGFGIDGISVLNTISNEGETLNPMQVVIAQRMKILERVS